MLLTMVLLWTHGRLGIIKEIFTGHLSRKRYPLEHYYQRDVHGTVSIPFAKHEYSLETKACADSLAVRGIRRGASQHVLWP